MTNRLKLPEMKRLKSSFRAAGCTVRDLDASTFEVLDDEFPVRTHVIANPYYVQLGTYILAKPQRPVRKSKVHELLCYSNLKSNVVKFTVDADSPDAQTQAWPIFASVKLVTGVVGGDYPATAIKNLFLLWLQDVAEMMANAPESFEMHPMMDIERLKDV
jgi:hypothetical protein